MSSSASSSSAEAAAAVGDGFFFFFWRAFIASSMPSQGTFFRMYFSVNFRTIGLTSGWFLRIAETCLASASKDKRMPCNFILSALHFASSGVSFRPMVDNEARLFDAIPAPSGAQMRQQTLGVKQLWVPWCGHEGAQAA